VVLARQDEVALVDFQYVGGGVGVKGVAYFVGSCLLPRECAAAVPGYWAPGQYDRDPYSEQLTSEVLTSLRSA